MIVFLHPQYFRLPKLSGRRDSLNSDSCSWSEAKSSPLLCATASRRGSAKRSRQAWLWTADWQCGCHFSSPRGHLNIQTYPLLPAPQFMERGHTRGRQVQGRAGGSTHRCSRPGPPPPIAHLGSGPCPEWWIHGEMLSRS